MAADPPCNFGATFFNSRFEISFKHTVQIQVSSLNHLGLRVFQKHLGRGGLTELKKYNGVCFAQSCALLKLLGMKGKVEASQAE